MRQLRIVVDLDNTVTNLHEAWLRLYNEEHGLAVTSAEITSWDMHECVEIGHRIYDYLSHPGLFRNLEPLAGAVEAVEAMHRAGHEIHVMSAPAREPDSLADKLRWFHQYLPFLDRKQFTLSHQKHRFATDIIIDDSPVNIREHVEHQPEAYRVGIAFPYNAEVADLMDLRAESYLEPAQAWKQILSFVESVAKSPG